MTSPTNAPSRQAKGERPDPLIGTVVGSKYRILSLIAKGGMGKVYRAEQQPLGRTVALKLLHVAKLRPGQDTQDSNVEVSEKRFLREASILAKLQHPNIVTIYDFGAVEAAPPSMAPPTVREGQGELPSTGQGAFLREDDEDDAPREQKQFFMAMELLVGETLHDRLHARKKLSPEETVQLTRQVARGLREAHVLGIVHRDLKPLNLMIVTDRDGEDQIKILDFGIVKMVEGLGAPAQELTEEGLFVGSPMYMAPEQIETGKVDARSDVYSLGVVIYRCLAGQTPFPNGSTMQIMMAHLAEQPVPLRDRAPETPTWLQDLVHRCLAKDPLRRPQSMDDLLRSLNEHAPVHSGTITLPNGNAEFRPSFSGLSGTGPILPPVDEHTVASGSSPTLTRSTALSAPRLPSSMSPAPDRTSRAWVLAIGFFAVLGVGIGGTIFALRAGGGTRVDVSGNGTASATTIESAPNVVTIAQSTAVSNIASATSSSIGIGAIDPLPSTSASVATKPSSSNTGKLPLKPATTASTKPSAVPTLEIQLKR